MFKRKDMKTVKPLLVVFAVGLSLLWSINSYAKHWHLHAKIVNKSIGDLTLLSSEAISGSWESGKAPALKNVIHPGEAFTVGVKRGAKHLLDFKISYARYDGRICSFRVTFRKNCYTDFMGGKHCPYDKFEKTSLNCEATHHWKDSGRKKLTIVYEIK